MTSVQMTGVLAEPEREWATQADDTGRNEPDTQNSQTLGEGIVGYSSNEVVNQWNDRKSHRTGSERCIWHWFIIAGLVLYLAGIFGLKKHVKKVHYRNLFIYILLQIFFTWMGSCSLDLPFCIVAIISALLAEPVRKYCAGEDEKEQ